MHLLQLLFCTVLIWLVSLILFESGKHGFALFFLIAGSLLCNYISASADPFLHLWDEQFHALVGKNMIHNPLHPRLYLDAALSFNYTEWAANQTWLHKQPLFLWVIGLSVKLFGTSALSVRIPGLILRSLLAYLVYDSGKILISKRTGFYAALLLSANNYLFEVGSGFNMTDQNDIFFLFFSFLSVWAWLRYTQRETPMRAMAIGVAVGCAILVKWLPALLIFGVWGLYEMFFRKREMLGKKFFIHIALAFGSTVCIVLPWQLWCAFRFPKEYTLEMERIGNHFNTVVEGHAGTWKYHFDMLFEFYGPFDFGTILFVWTFIAAIFMQRSLKWRVLAISWVAVIYIFYTLAGTKMPSFTLIAMPVVLLGVAGGFDKLISLIYQFFTTQKWPRFHRYIVSTSVILLFSSATFCTMNFEKICDYHTNEKPHLNRDRHKELAELKVIEYITKLNLPANAVIFNFDFSIYSHIQAMFFLDRPVYFVKTTVPMVSQLVAEGYAVYEMEYENDTLINDNPLVNKIKINRRQMQLGVIEKRNFPAIKK